MTDKIDLEALRGLLEEATPGPWFISAGDRNREVGTFINSEDDTPAIMPRQPSGHYPTLVGWPSTLALAALAPTLAQAYLDLLERVEWRPIETAPKRTFPDKCIEVIGARIVKGKVKRIAVVAWGRTDVAGPETECWLGWKWRYGKITHWMPLPQPVSEG
jgi:hypothetical protein